MEWWKYAQNVVKEGNDISNQYLHLLLKLTDFFWGGGVGDQWSQTLHYPVLQNDNDARKSYQDILYSEEL